MVIKSWWVESAMSLQEKLTSGRFVVLAEGLIGEAGRLRVNVRQAPHYIALERCVA
jgi:hypothetical protein